jgi:hypothetical protein
MPSRIVTYAHHYKRPPRKKVKAAAITGPAIVTAASKHDRDRHRETDGGEEASPEIKAFFARMMRPPGSAPNSQILDKYSEDRVGVAAEAAVATIGVRN